MFKILITSSFVEERYIKWNIWRVAVRPSYIYIYIGRTVLKGETIFVNIPVKEFNSRLSLFPFQLCYTSFQTCYIDLLLADTAPKHWVTAFGHFLGFSLKYVKRMLALMLIFFPLVLAVIPLQCQLQMLCHINTHNRSHPKLTYLYANVHFIKNHKCV